MRSTVFFALLVLLSLSFTSALNSTNVSSTAGVFNSSVSVNASTGPAMSSSSSISAMPSTSQYRATSQYFPPNSYSVVFVIQAPNVPVNVSLNQSSPFIVNLTHDIAFVIAQQTGQDINAIIPYIIITNIAGNQVNYTLSMRRLLSTGNTSVAFVIEQPPSLGAAFNVANVANNLIATINAGNITLPSVGATVPPQSALVKYVGAPSSTGAYIYASSTGNSASSKASAGVLALFGMLASAALLL